MLADRVESIMTRDVISIARKLKVDVALETMRQNDVRRLPVLSETGRLIGIITESDALVAMPTGSTLLGTASAHDEIPDVQDVMATDVVTVGPSDSIARAAQLMHDRKVGALPVLEDKKVVGIVTESDIFKFVVRQLGA